jgi:hypothetical protein
LKQVHCFSTIWIMEVQRRIIQRTMPEKTP